ncbi:hypothetical protein [Burkholderia sp. Ac-20365]|jgi:hypothetical protein|uniref:hypothetical protein n=1 Tax=Burkholderia sp. Ac-20365 TaxID=2703897 RepID=UPI00197B2AC3|nr:hypothetical protein [Burkholderia sp. Ac-20365]MBN3766957.1 hypothetical protein [Burkholderia sp. Ac-20365]
MKLKLIVDGNLAGWAQTALIVIGIAMLYFGLSVERLPRPLALAIVILAIPVAAIGGYCGRAKALGLKPFDNSYKKARDSYKVKDGENNK